MDHKHLKGRPPFPFETIALAVAFSPRLDGLLREAKLLADTFNANLYLIHIGEHTQAKEIILKEKCIHLGIDPEVRILWQSGEPVSSLLKTCKENMIDLLLLGALQRETMLRYYLGSVARSLSRKAKCSLLLLTDPHIEGSTFTNIVVDCVEHPKTLHTLNTAFYFARQMGIQELQVVKEVDQAGLAMAMSDDSTTSERNSIKEQLYTDAEEKIREKISNCYADGVSALNMVLFGRPGFIIRKYAKECKADLLVINSPNSEYGLIDRIFTHDMEYILEQLPCNILIVHSRPNNI